MARINLTSKTALVLFISLTIIMFAQAVWWVIFMAQLVDEKVSMAKTLGAGPDFIDDLHRQEYSRLVMLGLEGLFFLLIVLVGAWLIYRALVRTEQLKFQQQNFLMAVTHELKTPLASMKLYIDSLMSPKIADEKKTEIIPRMKGDVARLEKLVDNILEAGHFERSGYQLRLGSFNLSHLVNGALDNISQAPSKTPVEIERSLPETTLFYGDERALDRAIDAILENSVIYNDRPCVKINVTLTANKDELKLTISDNGVGLLSYDTTAIFDRFYRVGEEIRRSRPGSGLGLYLCREIILAHGGRIEARSEGLGKGSEFIITLKNNGDQQNNTDS